MKTEKNIAILVVDDDQRLRDLLKRYLSTQGYQVTAVSDTRKMDEKLLRNFYHLIVLDLMLPGEGGLDACKRLRANGNQIPVIMLTARGEDVDRIIGLELGADDYLSKPFNPRELVARINAVLRRHVLSESDISPIGDNRIVFGDFVFDISARTLSQGNNSVEFTSGLFDLLKVLASRPGKALSRAQLSALLKDREYDGADRAVDIQISRLRKLIESDSGNPRFIQTVWGVGYMFVPSGQNQ